MFKHCLEVLSFQYDLPIVLSLDDVFFDMGQNWYWTSLIIRENKTSGYNSSYQLLSPRDLETILLGNSEMWMNLYEDKKQYLLEKYYINKI